MRKRIHIAVLSILGCVLLVVLFQFNRVWRYSTDLLTSTQKSSSSSARSQAPFCTGSDEHCRLAEATLTTMPTDCRKNMRSLTFQYDEPVLGGFTTTYGHVWLAGDLGTQEIRALLIHECGHIRDFFTLTGTPRGQLSPFRTSTVYTYIDDPSLAFYQISWLNGHTKKPESTSADFVSDYAGTRAIEDFAETYAYYVLQRTAFERRAKRNPVLKGKFQWMEKQFQDRTLLAKGAAWDGKMPGVATGLPYEWVAEETGD